MHGVEITALFDISHCSGETIAAAMDLPKQLPGDPLATWDDDAQTMSIAIKLEPSAGVLAAAGEAITRLGEAGQEIGLDEPLKLTVDGRDLVAIGGP